MSNPIDTKIVSKLAEILNKNNLSGLEYENENCRVSLSRAFGPQPVAMPVPPAPAPIVVETTPPPAIADDNDDLSSLAGCVKSPMVGVVYLSSDPNSANYVKIGDIVSEGDTVCLIEAMKTFNPVKAHVGGRVTKILVESGDPVEYGEPLIIIE